MTRVKYLLRKCEVANFISHCDEGAIFHNPQGLFHVFRKENISYNPLFNQMEVLRGSNPMFARAISREYLHKQVFFVFIGEEIYDISCAQYDIFSICGNMI